jgi:hypothetical protein
LTKEASIKTKKSIKKEKIRRCQQAIDKRSKNQKGKVYEAKNRLTKEASIKTKNISKIRQSTKSKNG